MKRVIRGQGDPGGGIAQFPEEERKSRFEPEVDLMPGKKNLVKMRPSLVLVICRC